MLATQFLQESKHVLALPWSYWKWLPFSIKNNHSGAFHPDWCICNRELHQWSISCRLASAHLSICSQLVPIPFKHPHAEVMFEHIFIGCQWNKNTFLIIKLIWGGNLSVESRLLQCFVDSVHPFIVRTAFEATVPFFYH